MYLFVLFIYLLLFFFYLFIYYFYLFIYLFIYSFICLFIYSVIYLLFQTPPHSAQRMKRLTYRLSSAHETLAQLSSAYERLTCCLSSAQLSSAQHMKRLTSSLQLVKIRK